MTYDTAEDSVRYEELGSAGSSSAGGSAGSSSAGGNGIGIE